jgi:hypothetical protein
MRFDVARDALEDVVHRRPRRPSPCTGLPRIQDHPGQVERARRAVGDDVARAEPVMADAAPPPTFTTRGRVSSRPATSCAATSGSRSAGSRQSRT